MIVRRYPIDSGHTATPSVQVVAEPVEGRLRGSRTLEESLQMKNQAFDAALTANSIANSQGIITEVNAMFLRLWGAAGEADVVGKPIAHFFQNCTEAAAILATLEAGNFWEGEYTARRSDGSTFLAHGLATVLLNNNGKIIGYQSSVIDDTEVRAAEGKMDALRAELLHAMPLAMVSEISAGIIHQLSQPLSCLGTNLAVLRKLKAEELEQCGAMEIVDDVEADVTRMRDIVNHLRAIANPEQIARASNCLNVLAAEAIALLQARAKHGQVYLQLDLCESLPAIHADAIQLSQVIFNLTRNAIEASASVVPERRKVVITTAAHARGGVELCVRDHGCGMSAEVLERLFTPFFSTKSEGMGVGLRLCQTIVHAHDGQIVGFNNTDGIGATFRIELPAGSPLPPYPAAC